jgi:ABC-type glutathione transport system ATPase component
MSESVLSIEGLRIAYGDGPDTVHGIDLTVSAGEIVGLIGESGSGKSTVALSCLGLLPRTARVTADRLDVCGTDVRNMGQRDFSKLRGNTASMVFQDAMGALDPTMRVGAQVAEVVRRHRGLPRRAAREVAVELLHRVGIPEADRRARQYPHELSGGLRQRAAIAVALAGEPKLLFADEPTTALDVTVQAGILKLFRSIRNEFGVGIVLVSHDIGVIAQTADRVAVMLDGNIVEQGPVEQVLVSPESDYTRRLLAAAPTLEGPIPDAPPPGQQVLFTVQDAERTYHSGGRSVQALRGVSLEVREGEVLGIVGESGSGKSTLAKLLVCLEHPTAGSVKFQGTDILSLRGDQLREFRDRVQMVFQHPAGSLDPRMSVAASIAEPLTVTQTPPTEQRKRVSWALTEVGLPASFAERLPHELSGGQKQRVGIARSIVGSAKIVILDEPTSALDVSVQAQVLDLLDSLRRELGLTMVFISHNLAVVRAVCDRVAVMQHGKIVEIGPTGQIYDEPREQYTRALLSAVPSTDPSSRERRPPELDSVAEPALESA